MGKFCPKCIYKNQEATLSCNGFFTPCCWVDDELYRDQEWIKTLFKEHLKLENNDRVADIFKSKEWTDFYNMLKNNPEQAPPVCKEYCGSELITKEIKEKEINYEVIKKH
tara:strand:- start:232 stop:561 length:330 start_codon:yes stop_codon:yes gene_type:complete